MMLLRRGTMSHFEPCKKDGHYDYFGECLICEIESLHSQVKELTDALEAVTAEHSNTSPGYVEIHAEALGLAYAALAKVKEDK